MEAWAVRRTGKAEQERDQERISSIRTLNTQGSWNPQTRPEIQTECLPVQKEKGPRKGDFILAGHHSGVGLGVQEAKKDNAAPTGQRGAPSAPRTSPCPTQQPGSEQRQLAP